jgi:hypothetical protein
MLQRSVPATFRDFFVGSSGRTNWLAQWLPSHSTSRYDAGNTKKIREEG